MTQKKDDKVVIDVRIVDVGLLPPQYFTHDAVIEALRNVVRSDVVVHGNPVPPGAQAVKGHPRGPIALEARSKSAGFELKQAARQQWPVFIATLLAVIIGAVLLRIGGVL